MAESCLTLGGEKTTSFSDGNSSPSPGERHTDGAEILLLGCLEIEDTGNTTIRFGPLLPAFSPHGLTLAVIPFSSLVLSTSYFCN